MPKARSGGIGICPVEGCGKLISFNFPIHDCAGDRADLEPEEGGTETIMPAKKAIKKPMPAKKAAPPAKKSKKATTGGNLGATKQIKKSGGY